MVGVTVVGSVVTSANKCIHIRKQCSICAMVEYLCWRRYAVS